MFVIHPDFPASKNDPLFRTSDPTSHYNCIAWACEFDDRWMWPFPIYYWPSGIPMNTLVDSFTRLFEHYGYAQCADDSLEPGYLKVAIYAVGDNVTHAARQLQNGTWTSKLGNDIDVSHSLQSLIGIRYGNPVVFMRRLI